MGQGSPAGAAEDRHGRSQKQGLPVKRLGLVPVLVAPRPAGPMLGSGFAWTARR